MFVSRLAVRDDCDASQFESELLEIGETDGIKAAIERALSSFAATPIDVLVEGARQLLVQAIATHRQDCREPTCLEAANILAFLAHSIGAREADVKALPRLLLDYDVRCQQGGGCDVHALPKGGDVSPGAR